MSGLSTYNFTAACESVEVGAGSVDIPDDVVLGIATTCVYGAAL